MWWIGEHELCRWRSLQPSAPSSKTHLMNSQVTWKRSSLKQRFILNKQPILSTEGPCQEAQMMLRYQIPSHSSSHWTSEPWSSCMVVCALKYCVRMCCCLIACCPPALHRFTCCLALGFRVYTADRESWEQEKRRKHSKDTSCGYANPDSSETSATDSGYEGLHIIRILNMSLSDR